MVWRCVPSSITSNQPLSLKGAAKLNIRSKQLALPVHQESDLISRHLALRSRRTWPEVRVLNKGDGRGKHVLLAGIISGQVQRYNLRSQASQSVTLRSCRSRSASWVEEEQRQQGSREERERKGPEHPSCCDILYLKLMRIHD